MNWIKCSDELPPLSKKIIAAIFFKNTKEKRNNKNGKISPEDTMLQEEVKILDWSKPLQTKSGIKVYYLYKIQNRYIVIS